MTCFQGDEGRLPKWSSAGRSGTGYDRRLYHADT